MSPFLFLTTKLWWKKNSSATKVIHIMALVGIALSVASLVVTLGVVQGFEKDYKRALLNFHAHVTIHPDELFPIQEADIQKGIQASGLSQDLLLSATPFLYREALLIFQGKIKGVVLKGIPLKTDQGLGTRDQRLKNRGSSLVTRDSYIADHELRTTNHEIILGEALAKKLGILDQTIDHRPWTRDQLQNQVVALEKPVEVKLLIPKGKEVSAQDTKRLQVTGVFRSGLYELDSQFALMDLSFLKGLFDLDPLFQGFEIRLKEPEGADTFKKALLKSWNPSLSIQTWKELHQDLFEALQLEKFFFRILIGWMVFVASLNLVGVILLKILREKGKVAILKSLGLAPHFIRFIYALEGLVLGMGGIAGGLLLGFGILWGLQNFHWIPLDPQVYFLEELPVAVVWLQGLSIGILCWVGMGLISWWVAGRSVSLPIREGLHGPE